MNRESQFLNNLLYFLVNFGFHLDIWPFLNYNHHFLIGFIQQIVLQLPSDHFCHLLQYKLDAR